MIDLTPLDVRKKKGDFRRAVRGYDTELVDDFLDMAAERLEELVKQNVALTERAEHLQEQVASYREREMALNEALVTAQQLRSEAQAQADREAELVRREAQGQAERIVEEGQRSFRELARQIEMIQARKNHFVRTFRTLLERYLAELELDEVRVNEAVVSEMASATPEEPAQELPAEPVKPKQSDWLSSLVAESDKEESG
ncbi:MAG: DivIVA domain-containing protein [Gemmatimonadota bacterium]|jgi:DivIVA domain-containing protein